VTVQFSMHAISESSIVLPFKLQDFDRRLLSDGPVANGKLSELILRSLFSVLDDRNRLI
jgi:hypothetical protein